MTDLSLQRLLPKFVCCVLFLAATCTNGGRAPGQMPPGRYDVLVETGDESPDGNGGFSTFWYPALNDSGDAAFYAVLADTDDGTDDDTGIFRASVSGLTRIEREYDVEIAGVRLTNLDYYPAIDSSGRVAYTADYTKTTSPSIPTREELRLGNGTTTTIAAYEGQTVPGGGKIGTLSENALSRNGQVAFRTFLTDTSGGSADNYGLYRVSGTYLQEIARKGQPAPGGGSTYWYFYDAAINDNGEVSVMAELAYPSYQHGVFSGVPGSVDAVIRTGDWVPGGGEFYYPHYSTGTVPINSSGQVAFSCQLQNTPGGEADDTALYRGDSSSLTEICREGDPAPDGNGTFGFGSGAISAINSSGLVAFRSYLSNTIDDPHDDEGIFIGSGGAVTQIAREGRPAPDGNGTFLWLGAPALNDAGVVAFYTEFWDTAGGDDDNGGIYLSDGVEMVRVAREGDLLLGSRITALRFAHGSGSNGPTGSGLNESSQVAYNAELADGRQAVVLFTPDIHWRTAGSGSWSSKANWTLGLAPAQLYDTYIDPMSGLNVDGPSAHAAVKRLFVGATTSGRAVLDLNGSGDLTALNGVVVGPRGEIRVGSERVLTAPALENTGIVSGSGQIDAQLLNYSGGEVRVAGGERLRLTATTPGSNAGEIEVNGGEVEFDATLVNQPSTGLIAGENATFRFNGALTNRGSLAMSFGTSRVHGEIENTTSGRIIVSGKSQATFYDDVVNGGSIQVSTGSTAVFFGELSGNGCAGSGDVFLEGDTRPGFSAGTMDFGGEVSFGALSNTYVELGHTEAGLVCDQINVADQVNLGGTLWVSLLDEFSPGLGDTFDIFDWGERNGEFSEVNLPGLSAGLNWDTSALYSSGEIGVVPEPATLGLLAMGLLSLALFGWRRRRCS